MIWPERRRSGHTRRWLTGVGLLLSAHLLFGQAVQYPPETLTINGKAGYYRHGSNSTSPASTNLSVEVRDSVTITSLMTYFVLPAIELSPDWYNSDKSIKDVKDISNLKSQFSWSVKNGSGVSAYNNTSSYDSDSALFTVRWTTLGIDSLKVKEIPTKTLGCVAKNTVIPVVVIAKPTFDFQAGTGGVPYSETQCHTQADVTAGVSFNFPHNAISSSSQLWIDYTVDHSKNGVTISTTPYVARPVESLAALKFTDYGEYTIHVTKVTDRVSRKSGVNGVIDTNTYLFDFILVEQVNTGPVYRIPNKYD
ncbi:MAG: hypothetical protein LBE71_05985 [Dysgonamonadaceae bacterium]|nr:hypothetical protein [Dysgonamonadaceae bacterium]